jgi:hypothetical protein
VVDEDEDRLTDEEVEDAVRSHEAWVDECVQEWNRFQASIRTQFWSEPNMWTGKVPGLGVVAGAGEDEDYPVKVEVNRTWGFLNAHVANLFYRNPTTEVAPPEVVEVVGPGRPAELTAAADRVRAFNDSWIKRSDLQECSTYVLQQALTFGISGYKLGPRDTKSVMARVWVDVIRPWELLLDDRATSWEQQTYRGHIRYERIDRARKIVGKGGEPWPENVELQELPDVVADENAQHAEVDRRRVKKYVRLLEFYDLIAREQRFYLVEGRSRAARVRKVGKSRRIPWDMPNGRVGVPIIPVVLSNEPDFPLRGIPALRRIYQLNAEQNLLLTIYANRIRRDAASITAIPEGAPAELTKAIRAAKDGTVVALPPELINEKLWKHLDSPQLGSVIDKWAAALQEAYRDTQGMSDVMQGRQLKYASATEAEIVAGSGETMQLEISSRMSEAMARVIELADIMLAGDLKGSLHVRTVEGMVTLTKEDLLQPWTIGVVDAGTTPVREQRKRADFLAVQKTLIELIRIASAPDVQPAMAAGPGMPAAPSEPAISAEVRKLAALQNDYIVQQWQLPETFTWAALSSQKPKGPPPPTPEELALVDELIGRAVDGVGNAAPPTPIPEVP